MKTKSTIKSASSLFSALMLMSLTAHAARNIDLSHTYATGNYNRADFGASATFAVYDDSTLPVGNGPGFYSISATGNVKGKVLRQEFTVIDANGTAKINSNGVAQFSGRLRVPVLNQTLFDYSNIDMKNFRSPQFIKEETASHIFPLPIGGLPFNITTTVKTSLALRFCGDVYMTPTKQFMPQIKVSIGPEADLAATAEASVGVGVNGWGNLSVGASGTLKLGKVALKAEATAFPTTVTQMELVNRVPRLVTRNGGRVEAGIVASTRGLSGNLKLFGELWFWIPFTQERQTFRASHTIATFPSTTAVSVNLLRPIGFTWF